MCGFKFLHITIFREFWTLHVHLITTNCTNICMYSVLIYFDRKKIIFLINTPECFVTESHFNFILSNNIYFILNFLLHDKNEIRLLLISPFSTYIVKGVFNVMTVAGDTPFGGEVIISTSKWPNIWLMILKEMLPKLLE